MMYQGFTGDYEAPSSRCSSASPAGDSLTYYPSPADSFSSMGSPVNPQVRGWLPAGGVMQGVEGGGGVPARHRAARRLGAGGSRLLAAPPGVSRCRWDAGCGGTGGAVAGRRGAAGA